MTKVAVYRNLSASRDRHIWSLKVADATSELNGLVFAHASDVVLNNARFVVNEKGRMRTLNRMRRNVHAYVTGELVAATIVKLRYAPDFEKPRDVEQGDGGTFRTFTYNPFKRDTFYDPSNGKEITRANAVKFTGNHALYSL